MATLARFPFVSKTEILRAYRPGAEPSERTFRTLREHGLVSAGLVIRHRRHGRVVGQLRCYATLNLDAAVLARHERTDEAAHVARDAGQFETDWQPLVAELAANFDLEDFEAFRSARNILAHSLGPATEQLERLHQRVGPSLEALVTEQFVRVAETAGQWTTLQLLTCTIATVSRRGAFPAFNDVGAILAKSIPQLDVATAEAVAQALEPIARVTERLAIDSFLPRAANLTIGDVALLRIEHSAGLSLLSLIAALQEGGCRPSRNSLALPSWNSLVRCV
jgi:hypothetical protein